LAGSKLKTIGTVLELEFAAECIRRGAIVSQPFGDNSHYDFLVDNGLRIYRVQVKAASLRADKKSYSVNLTRKLPKMRPADPGGSSRSVPYEEGTLDCIVTKARGVWFFFDNPHLLSANESVYPETDLSRYKGNRGWEQWNLIGLGSSSAVPESTKLEDILLEVIFDDTGRM
jgi:hypothetical protein